MTKMTTMHCNDDKNDDNGNDANHDDNANKANDANNDKYDDNGYDDNDAKHDDNADKHWQIQFSRFSVFRVVEPISYNRSQGQY